MPKLSGGRSLTDEENQAFMDVAKDMDKVSYKGMMKNLGPNKKLEMDWYDISDAMERKLKAMKKKVNE